MLSERMLLLIGKKIAGDATAAELEELQAWQARHPEALELEQLAASLQQTDTTFVQLEDGQQVLQKGWKAVSEEIEKQSPELPPRRSTRGGPLLKWMAMAASLAAVLWLAYNFWGQHSRPAGPPRQNQVSTRHGSKSRIELPDGTKVWLNAGSHLTYADGFLNGNREVTLSGEAYFEVSGDAAHPLVVNTHSMKITVLGTRFNVKAYTEDVLAEATLLSGKIAVTLAGSKRPPIILKPLQKLTVARPRQGTPLPPRKLEVPVPVTPLQAADSIVDETAWVYNRLTFKKEPFDDVIRKMERWYNVTITVENASLRNQLMSGEFTTENIEQALKALQFTTPFHFSIRGDTVMIR